MTLVTLSEKVRRRILKTLGPVPLPPARHQAIPLNRAWFCSVCLTVGDNCRECAGCGSNAILALSRIIPQHQDTIRLVPPAPAANPLVSSCKSR